MMQKIAYHQFQLKSMLFILCRNIENSKKFQVLHGMLCRPLPVYRRSLAFIFLSLLRAFQSLLYEHKHIHIMISAHFLHDRNHKYISKSCIRIIGKIPFRIDSTLQLCITCIFTVHHI